MAKILLFGGSGALGQEILKLDRNIIAPTHQDVNINYENDLSDFMYKGGFDVVINAAAETDNRAVEKNPEKGIRTNIIGAANLSILCKEYDIRLVYISTDYIYKGDRGNYLETDEILPFNLYSWFKLGGECSTRSVRNHLIIRTSFGKNRFDYGQAFTDKWSSKDYVDTIAPMIYEAACSPLIGILNLGSDRKTLFAHAIERRHDVKPVKISDTNYFTPYDTSLNLQKWQDYKSEKSIAKPHTICRACGHNELIKYLDLGLMPLANNLEFTSQRAKNQPQFPLQLMYCKICHLSQLSVVIDPKEMFSNYTYRSSVNQGYVKHCRKMAKTVINRYSIDQHSFVIDIAGNDGTLLKEFRDEIRCDVLNVDPASNIVSSAEAIGIESISEFLSETIAHQIVSNYRQADIITATNICAHVDDLSGFLEAAACMLSAQGVLIVEVPYVVDFIEGIEFDTIYFEHVSYLGIQPMSLLCTKLDLAVIDVERIKIHGGSIRFYIARNDSDHRPNLINILGVLDDEISIFDKENVYIEWGQEVNRNIEIFGKSILKLKKDGFKISAFAASAKGNTLLNACKINTDLIDYIVDETPEKIGKYSPGTGIKIVSKHELIKNPPDVLILLSWNFKDEIIEKVKAWGYTGKFVIPIPEYEVI